MRRIWVGVLLALTAVSANGQDLAKALKTALVGKQVYPRGFSSDPTVLWRWDSATSALVMEPALVHTLGVVAVKSVKVKGDHIEIKGERRTVIRHKQEVAASSASEGVTIFVDTPPAAASVLSSTTLLSQIFFDSSDEAVANLPEDYLASLPAFDSGNRCCSPLEAGPKVVAARHSPTNCDGAGAKRMRAPRVVSMVDAEFSEEARRKKISGNVNVGFTVSTDGTPQELWLAVPAGNGLDEKAFEAVSKYKFVPATCHNVPVPVVLFVEVNFQIF